LHNKRFNLNVLCYWWIKSVFFRRN